MISCIEIDPFLYRKKPQSLHDSGAALPMFVMRVWCGSSQVKSIKDRCLTIGANPTSQGGKQASKLFACLLACLLARADWCGLETPQVSALPRTVPSQKGGPTAD